MLTTNVEIENEITEFFRNLAGTANDRQQGIYIVAMRQGNKITLEQSALLIKHVTQEKIKEALKDIEDLKAPGLDGYGAKLFKLSWSVVNKDVIATINEFFDDEKMYKPIISTYVTLIPKSSATKSIKDYRPISCCTLLLTLVRQLLYLVSICMIFFQLMN